MSAAQFVGYGALWIVSVVMALIVGFVIGADHERSKKNKGEKTMKFKEKLGKYSALKQELQEHIRKHSYWLRIKELAEKEDTAITGRNPKTGHYDYEGLDPCVKEIFVKECGRQLKENKEMRKGLEKQIKELEESE